MKIILLKDVPKLGKQYEVKEVKSGYGRNFIIARGLGTIATKPMLAQVELRRRELETAVAEKRAKLAKEAAGMMAATVTLAKRANELGHLFESISKEDLATALRLQTGFDIEADWINLEKPIKEVGTHTIPVAHEEVKTSFQLIVEAEGGEKKVEKKAEKKVKAKK